MVSEGRLKRAGNRVLLVAADSQRAARVNRAFALASPAHDVDVVKGTDEAVRKLDEQPYDAVILDPARLGADGLDALLQISTGTRGTPVLVLTDLGRQEAEALLSATSPCYTIFADGDNPEFLPGMVAHALREHPLALSSTGWAGSILEAERVLAVLEVLLDTFRRATGPDGVLARAADAALLAVPHACGAEIHLLDEETGLLVAKSSSPPNSDILRASGLLGGPQLGELLSGKSDAVYVSDAKLSSTLRAVTPKARSLLVLPLVTPNRVVGTLSLSSEEADVLDAGSQRLLAALAQQAATAVDATSMGHRLQVSEKTRRTIMDGAADAICLVDISSWRLLEMNRQGEKLIGHPLDQLGSTTADDVVFVREKECRRSTLRELASSGESCFEDLSLLRRDGHPEPVSVRVDPVPHGDTVVVRVALRDHRAWEETEQQLIHATKLVALGRLTASLVHEISNPLQALCSSIGLLSEWPVDEEKRARYLEIASKEVERLVNLVQGMVDFCRPAGETQELVDVDILLEDALALTGKELEHHGIEVARGLSPGLRPVEAVASHLRQVFINLVLFYVEAMPHGGHLTVRTYVDEGSEQLLICFSATGDGLPPGDLPRVFERFYSSKETMGGLGLAASRSIVERHGGNIEVRSRAGTGAALTVRLPLAGARSA